MALRLLSDVAQKHQDPQVIVQVADANGDPELHWQGRGLTSVVYTARPCPRQGDAYDREKGFIYSSRERKKRRGRIESCDKDRGTGTR